VAWRVIIGLFVALALAWRPEGANAVAEPSFDPALERQFIEGINSFARRDYDHAELMFRRLLDREPSLLRVRLELARTLYMQKKDEQADYHFRLAAGEHPSAPVLRNIIRFREAIRARRSWGFNLDIGIAPDSNINSATDKELIDIYGLPFHLDPGARAKSGTGVFAGADASVRVDRFGRIPVYLGAYGRWTRYPDHHLDDAYVGAEAGPEFKMAAGRLRTTVSGLERWYAGKPLVGTFGGHADYERLLSGGWTVGGSLLIRHVDYARRSDVDGWDCDGRVSVSRPLGPNALGFGYVGIERRWANDPGQAFWRESLGVGVLKEFSWGLRPRLSIDIARQVGDGPLAPFNHQRRDWLLQGSVGIYKRDWNIRGFAPSLSLAVTRNLSTLQLYDQRRIRGEIRLTKAF
jgi:hypothetical protein